MMDALDELGYDEVKHRFDRGDYHDLTEQKAVRQWLRNQEKEQQFLASCKRASISAALDAQRTARRANLIAFLALLAAVIAAREDILVLISHALGYFVH